jgi:dCMP deaminase
MLSNYSEKWLNYFFSVAELTGQLSYATRLKVGAVLVRDKRILLCGYNGMPPGMDNVCEDENNKTKKEVLHAEENLILYAAKKGISLNDSSLFITHSPCMFCSRLIFGSGIKEIFYREDYKCSDGIEFLQNNNVSVYKI